MSWIGIAIGIVSTIFALIFNILTMAQNVSAQEILENSAISTQMARKILEAISAIEGFDSDADGFIRKGCLVVVGRRDYFNAFYFHQIQKALPLRH